MNTSYDSSVYCLDGEQLYSVKELARKMNVSDRKVRDLIYRGVVPLCGGEPVKLERWKTVGGIRSSIEAVHRLHKKIKNGAGASA